MGTTPNVILSEARSAKSKDLLLIFLVVILSEAKDLLLLNIGYDKPVPFSRPEKNMLYYGDNFDVLQRYLRDESVDLVYLDPPFNSRQDYNVLFAEKDGSKSLPARSRRTGRAADGLIQAPSLEREGTP